MADETTVTTEAQPAKPSAATDQPTKPVEQSVSLTQAMEAFGDTFSGRKKKKVEPEKPVEPKKEDEQQKEAYDDSNKTGGKEKPDEKLKEDTEQSHKPKPKVKAAQKQSVESGGTVPVGARTHARTGLDETRLAEIAAEAGARASTETISRIEQAKSKSTEKAVDTDNFKPPKEYTEQYAAFKVMAKTKPDKYGGLVEEFKTFVKEEENYIRQWKRDHPGETWNGEADEHNEFYQKATPTYEDSDLRRAEINLELGETKKELRKEVMDEVEPKLKKLDEMERAETLRSLQPAVAAAERTAMSSILKAIDPVYDKFVEPADLAKLKDEDPVAFDIALEVGRDAVPFVAEVTRLWQSKGAVKAQENNTLHQYIHGYASKMMELIKALPEDEQMRDGKKFATWTEFNSMTQAQQARHWIISDQDLIERKMLDAQEIAKERIASEDKKLSTWAKRKGMTQGNAQNSAQTQSVKEKPVEAKPLPVKESNNSPSVGSRTQVSPNGEAAPSSQPAWLEQFGSILSGRKV